MATNKTTTYQRVKNLFFPGVSGHKPPSDENNPMNATIQKDARNLNKYRGPVQVPRIKVDTSYWRAAISEAERPLSSLPYRVMMQQIYLDTVLNGHVTACMQKRKNLTLLKKYHICDDNGVTDEAATELLQTDWFNLMRNYIHDATYYGYSLITFGDMIDGNFPNVQITRRTDVSPDRLVLSSFQYIPTGINFMSDSDASEDGEKYFDWSLYVPTASENGVSKCGYGLLYKVALYEIIMRSLIGWNTDYTERFGQPTIVIKTNKDSEEERDAAENAAKNLASSPYIILDKQDEFSFEDVSDSGTGWKSYDNLEGRCKKIISSIILGHEDGISSTPGKLGSGQGEESSTDKALAECESTDSRFEEYIINNHLLPKLIKLGVKIPVGKKYKLKNDSEEAEEKEDEAANAKNWAEVAYTMSQAGIKMDVNEFIERTGLKAEAIVEAPAPTFSSNIKNKLKKTYSNVPKRV